MYAEMSSCMPRKTAQHLQALGLEVLWQGGLQMRMSAGAVVWNLSNAHQRTCASVVRNLRFDTTEAERDVPCIPMSVFYYFIK